MPTPQEMVRQELARRTVAEELTARQGQEQKSVGRRALERVESVMPGPAIAMSFMRDPAMIPEAAGAAAGAAIGAPGGVPLMGALGAGGARVGRFVGDVLMQGEQPTDEEMTAAGIGGAAGPVAGGAVRHGARIFSKLPTAGFAKKSAERAAIRTQQHLAGTELERVLVQTADILDQDIAAQAAKIAKLREVEGRTAAEGGARFGRFFLNTPEGEMKDLTPILEAALNRYRDVVPRELRKVLTNPEAAVARAASMVPEPQPNLMGGLVGALTGGALSQDLTGMASGAVIGQILGQMRGRAAFRLSQNEAFVNWATGLAERSSVAQGALAFVGDVLMQATDQQQVQDAQEYYDKLLDWIEENPLPSLIPEAEGAELGGEELRGDAGEDPLGVAAARELGAPRPSPVEEQEQQPAKRGRRIMPPKGRR